MFELFPPSEALKNVLAPRLLLTVKSYRMMIKIYFHNSVHKGVGIYI